MGNRMKLTRIAFAILALVLAGTTGWGQTVYPAKVSGLSTTGHCAQFAGPTTVTDSGSACGGGGGGGTVTNVTVPAPLTGTGCTGNCVITWTVGQPANEFLATPDGATGAVTLRTLAANDLKSAGTVPDLLSEQRTVGVPIFGQAEYQVVAAGATNTLINYTGGSPGYIDGIEYALDSTDTAAFNSATVNVYIDGSGTPSITIPAPQFFQSQYLYGNASGSAFSNAAFQNKYFAANTGPIPGATTLLSGTFTCMMPIPFSTGIKVTINNGSGSATARTFWHVKVQIGVANTWPYTRKLRMAYVNINAPSSNTPEQLLNITGKGRYVGLWFLTDDVPNSMNPLLAELEGNWQLYVDKVSGVWTANGTPTLGTTIIDSNGNEETVTTAGTNGGSQPSWARAAGATTTDGSTVWTLTPGQPTNTWIASRPYIVNMSIVDPNGFIQRVTTAGTVGSSQPTWNTTPGGTTTDNGVTWTNQGNTYLHASWMVGGTEEYFSFGGYYFLSLQGLFTNNGYVGTTFGNWGGSPTHSNTVNPSSISAYRYHTVDPIRFDSQLTLMWHVGDTSEVSWSSGSPDVWVVVYYYTE